MPATVTLDLLDTTDAGIAAFASGLSKADAASKKLTGTTAELNSELAKSKSATSGQTDKGVLGIRAEQVTATIQGVKFLAQNLKFARESLRSLSEQGYENFSKLERSIQGAESAIKSLGNSATASTGSFRVISDLAENAEYLADVFNRTSREKREQDEQARLSGDMLKKVDAQLASQKEQNATTEIQSQTQLAKKIADQRELMEQLGRSASMTAEERLEHGRRLINLENQQAKLTQQKIDAQKWLATFAKQAAADEAAGFNANLVNITAVNAELQNQADLFNLMLKNGTQTTERIAEGQRNLQELLTKKNALMKEEADWQKRLDAIESERGENQFSIEVRREDNEQKILRLLREEKQLLESLRTNNATNAKQAEELSAAREKSLKRIQQLQGKLDEFDEQMFQAKKEREQKTRDEQIKTHAEAVQQANERMKKALEERQAKINALAEQVKPAVAGIKANVTDQQKIREMLRIRQERAKRGVLAANKGKPADDVNKKLREAERKVREQFAADLRRTRKPPKGRRTRDGRVIQPKPPKAGGPMARAMPIDPLEAEQATNDLVRKQIDNAANQGKFAGDTAAAIRAAADAQQKASETMVLHDQELQGLKRQLEAIQGLNAATNNNARQRAMGR